MVRANFGRRGDERFGERFRAGLAYGQQRE
jgi:hypothetical protein